MPLRHQNTALNSGRHSTDEDDLGTVASAEYRVLLLVMLVIIVMIMIDDRCHQLEQPIDEAVEVLHVDEQLDLVLVLLQPALRRRWGVRGGR